MEARRIELRSILYYLSLIHIFLGLVEDLGLLGLEDGVLDLHFGDAELLGDVLADGGVRVMEGRQAVQEDRRGIGMAMSSVVTR